MPVSKGSLQDTCQDIQILTGLDDKAWKKKFGNNDGLYGLIHTREDKTRVEEMNVWYDDLIKTDAKERLRNRYDMILERIHQSQLKENKEE